MPLICHTERSSGIAGVWHILESESELLELARPDARDLETLSTYRNESRRKQWLACRVLLGELIKSTFVKIVYNPDGKPLLKGFLGEISFSHTKEYAAVILDSYNPVGIDIEKVKPRIEKVRSRFLNEDELEYIDQLCCRVGDKETGRLAPGGETALPGTRVNQTEISERRLEILYIYWCSKEALYKIHGKHSVDLKNDIHIRPFDYFCKLQGYLSALLTTPEGTELHRLQYEMISDHMLVYTLR